MIGFQTLAQLCTGNVLNTLGEGILLTAGCWFVLRYFRVRSAFMRFSVWFSALLAVVLMPLLVRTGAADILHTRELEFPSGCAAYLFSAWAVIASILVARLGVSLQHVRRLRRECREIDGAFHPELVSDLRSRASSRKVQLLVSDDIRVPTAIGFFRPAIVLPAWTLSQLSTEELKVILLHEFEHLRRWDDWTNLAQKLLKAIFFFHPGVWFIESRLALEREIACDDAVLQQTANPAGYAASLVSVAEKAFSEKERFCRALALAQGALGRMRHTSMRIAQILDPGRAPVGHGWRPAMAMVAAVFTFALLATPYMPELISFHQAQPELSAANTSLPALGNGEIMKVPAVQASFKFAHAENQRPLLTHPAVRKSSPAVIPASVQLRHSKARAILAKAKPAQAPDILMLLQLAGFDRFGSPVFTLTLWRVSSGADGMPRVEETFVMNSI